MDIVRAFTFSFEDKQAAEKLVIIAVMAFLSLIPLLGLVALAALLGYVVLLVRNVRDRRPQPLPRWSNYADVIAAGGNVLAAALIYNLPNLLMACIMSVVPLMLAGSDLFTIGYGVFVLCCAIPMLLIYNLITWPMLALGTVRYAETERIGVYFQFGDLLATLWAQPGVTIRWMLLSFLASLALGLFNAIPCLGTVIALTLIYPVQGHLLGQFGRLIEDGEAPKPKR